MTKTYAILGATGNTGRVVVKHLLEAGHHVKAVSRKGGEAQANLSWHTGEVTDAAFLTQVFSGADAAYLLIPPAPQAPDFLAYQRQAADAITEAVRASGLKKAVMLSSQWAQYPTGNGPIAGLHYLENQLAFVEGLDVVFLRPTFFMENLFAGLYPVKTMGIFPGTVLADRPIPMIHTADIGTKAAELLLKLDFEGKSVVDLLGPCDYTYTEAVGILGQALGKPELPYVQVSYQQAFEAAVGAGFSPSIANLYNELNKGFNDGSLEMTPRTAQNTTSTPLEAFAPVFAAVASQPN